MEEFFQNKEEVLGLEDEARVSDDANAAEIQVSKDLCLKVEKSKSCCAVDARNQLEEVIDDVQDILVEELVTYQTLLIWLGGLSSCGQKNFLRGSMS